MSQLALHFQGVRLKRAATERSRRRLLATLQPFLDEGRTPAEILRLVRSVLDDA